MEAMTTREVPWFAVCAGSVCLASAFLERQYTTPNGWEWFLIAAGQHRGIADAIANREGMCAERLAREYARERSLVNNEKRRRG